MSNLFKRQANSNLRGLIIWEPMIPSDDSKSTEKQLSADSRFLVQGWNEDRTIAQAFSKTLNLKVPAWDVYLVYKPKVRWDAADPPMPDFWMHQLGRKSGAYSALQLNSRVLEKEVDQMLNAPRKN